MSTTPTPTPSSLATALYKMFVGAVKNAGGPVAEKFLKSGPDEVRILTDKAPISLKVDVAEMKTPLVVVVASSGPGAGAFEKRLVEMIAKDLVESAEKKDGEGNE